MRSPAPADLTFETGYTRLQTIATRLGDDEVPVSEMVDLYAEGKGLEGALLAHLDEAKGRIEAIERGEGRPAVPDRRRQHCPAGARGRPAAGSARAHWLRRHPVLVLTVRRASRRAVCPHRRSG